MQEGREDGFVQGRGVMSLVAPMMVVGVGQWVVIGVRLVVRDGRK